MNKNNKKVKDLISRMKALGIEVADVSIYPMTQAFHADFRDVVIIAGYLPDKACLMTVDTDFTRADGQMGFAKFSIDGELNVRAELLLKSIKRRPVHSEMWQGGNIFSINTYTERLDTGFAFFRTFLDVASEHLLTAFTESVHLWYVPEYSDAVLALEKEYGKYDDRIYVPFIKKVYKKLPRGMFSSKQRL